jgi:hypothetical protein
MQMLRRNVPRIPACTDASLQLALLESSVCGNHGEALSLVQHAMSLEPSSLTALTTVATVAARAGLTGLAVLAVAASDAPWTRRSVADVVWPLGLPPHVSVTQPAEPFWDADMAERRAIAAEETWHPPGALQPL